MAQKENEKIGSGKQPPTIGAEIEKPKDVEEFTISQVLELEGRLGFMLKSKNREMMVSVPSWAIEQRQVEYELDPSDYKTALSMLLHEPFLPKIPDEEIPLFSSDHRAEAKQRHTKAIKDVAVNVTIPDELASQLGAVYPGSKATRKERNKRFVEARCRVKEERAKNSASAASTGHDKTTFAWKNGEQ